MSKITLGELWEKLDKNEFGTEKAEYKLKDELRVIVGGDYRGILYYCGGKDDATIYLDSVLARYIEWPIQEKKEKVFYPALVAFTDSFGRRSKIVEYFESKDEVSGVFSLPEYDSLELLEWNPEGYPPITIKEE